MKSKWLLDINQHSHTLHLPTRLCCSTEKCLCYGPVYCRGLAGYRSPPVYATAGPPPPAVRRRSPARTQRSEGLAEVAVGSVARQSPGAGARAESADLPPRDRITRPRRAGQDGRRRRTGWEEGGFAPYGSWGGPSSPPHSHLPPFPRQPPAAPIRWRANPLPAPTLPPGVPCAPFGVPPAPGCRRPCRLGRRGHGAISDFAASRRPAAVPPR